MKYFIDTEFKEKPNTIDLISIGIVCENGKKYYALNKDFNLKEIWKDEWLRNNVLLPIYIEHVHGDMRNHISFSQSTIKGILKGFGKTTKQISEEIKEFIYSTNDNIHPDTVSNFDEIIKLHPIEFYGYYSDYDWVVFCWIFGRMLDLPKGFPMYCKDLKQTYDEILSEYRKLTPSIDLKKDVRYPKQTDEHNALSDAIWNYELYKFLSNL